MCSSFPLCNKRSDRAPRLFGKPFILCWRCTGILIGYILSKFIATTGLMPKTILPLLLLIPCAIDGTLQYGFGIESTNIRRVTTGILAGLVGLAHISI